jgi:hypothetical protein
MRGLYCVILFSLLIGCSHGNTTIKTLPTEANVFINDQNVGKTPLNLNLKKQTHRLRIEKEGYIIVNDYITVVKRNSILLGVLLFPMYWIFADDFKYTFQSEYSFDLKPKEEVKK